MKKTFMIAFVLAAVAGLIVAGSAFAQGDTPPTFGDRGPADGTGLLHDYMSNAMAQALGLSVEEFEARHDAGETFFDIAFAEGFTAEETPTLMQNARTSALDVAGKDGVITQEQVEWMQSRGFGRGGNMGENGDFGSGVCDGSGQFEGSSMRGSGHGGRWQSTTP